MIRLDQPRPMLTSAPPRRRRLIGISLLPAAATLGNLLCGFGAILCCVLTVSSSSEGLPRAVSTRVAEWMPTYLSVGALLIVLSLVFDALDGRLARLTRRTSAFGAQLDSLSDVVSFGVAPATLVLAVLLRTWNVSDAGLGSLGMLQWRLGLVAALAFVSCAAIRLARYNVESAKGEEALRAFSGLPTPGGGSLVVALVALHERLVSYPVPLLGVDGPEVLRWAMLGALLACGLLMVSRVEYAHVFNQYVRRRRPPTDLVWLLLIISVGVFSLELLLAVVALGYVASGLVLTALPGGRTAPTR